MRDFSLSKLKRWLPARPAGSHKGDFGHLLIIAGSKGMTGAAALAARAALRSGAGLVTVALPETQIEVVAASVVEALTLPLPCTSSGQVRGDAVGRLMASHQARGYTAMAIGPGLGTGSEVGRAVVGALGSLRIPAVIDADAINLLSLNARGEVRTLLKRRSAPHVFTPHPGEMSRLLRATVASVESDRAASAELLCREFGGVCLLKGAKTLITDGERRWINPTGNAGLAKGGAGDVLTGIIGAIWCQRLRAGNGGPDAIDTGFEAAALGAYLHGFAADQAVKEKTARCLVASDVIEALPAAFKKLGG